MHSDPNHIAYVRGDKAFKAGRFAEAAQYFLLALEEWPEDWQAMHALGNSCCELKKPRKAEKWFRRAIELAPPEEGFGLIYNLGNALFDQGRYDDAIETYQQVPHGHAIWPRAKRNIGLCQLRLGK